MGGNRRVGLATRSGVRPRAAMRAVHGVLTPCQSEQLLWQGSPRKIRGIYATGTASTAGRYHELSNDTSFRLLGTSNNGRFCRVMGHNVGAVFNLVAVFTAPSRPLLRLNCRGTSPSCRGEPFQRHQAANVVGQVLGSRSWRAPAPCQSCARAGPADAQAPLKHTYGVLNMPGA